MGGLITFESQLGHGSTFCVDLPWAFDDAVVDQTFPDDDRDLPGASDPLITPHILPGTAKS
jgi:hypothetical protein